MSTGYAFVHPVYPVHPVWFRLVRVGGAMFVDRERPPVPHPVGVHWSLAIFFHPEGVASLSPGLLYSATLGNGRRRPTPTGLWLSPTYNAHPILRCASAAVPESHLADGEGRNPFRVGTQSAVVPKVAEYSNLGL